MSYRLLPTLVAALATVLLVPASARAASVTRGPYLQMATSDAITVRWRTDVATDSRVRYGLSPESQTWIADDATATTEHEVRITGLAADTRYFYSVGSTAETLAGGDAEHYFATSPFAGTPRETRIWVIGDSGTADANARAVRDAYQTLTGARQTDVWLMLGDNAYPEGTDAEYQAAVFETYPELLRNTVLWTTLGNHDGHTADSASESGPYYDIFTLPRQAQAGGVVSGTEAYYSFDYGNIHFICLDSYETDRSPGGAMLSWLEDDLIDTDADWVIAFWHHPPYSKGSHNSDSESRLIEMRENVLPILESYGVELVLAGHSHSYERSFLIDQHYGRSRTLQPSMILDGGDGRVGGDGAYEKPSLGPAAHEGAVYVVAGSSGQTSGGPLNHPVMFISVSQLGSVVLDVDGNTLDATFVNGDGQVTDTFTMVKGTSASVCGNGLAEAGEECDGGDLAGASCFDQGCTSGVPTCTPTCTLDYGTCGGCPICDNDGVCELGEDCNGCANDCISGGGASCGNGVCEVAEGEDCVSCPSDCNGKQNVKSSRRFCCGNGGENPVGCSDVRCDERGWTCTSVPSDPFCCGDLVCGGGEDSATCGIDCPAPICGDGSCDAGEGQCSCPADCPPQSEALLCSDGADNDCDGLIDCDDEADCGGDQACICLPSGASCSADAECCGGRCKGGRNKTCQ